MHRIDTPTAKIDKFGVGKNGFTTGNPQTGELPTALDADYFDSVQEEICTVIESSGIALNKNNRSQLLAALNLIYSKGRLISPPRVITASGTYTPTPGTKSIIVKMVGGGGGGGGALTTSASNASCGAGGQSGAYIETYITSLAASYPVVIGVGGTGGAGSNAGSAGGNTTINGLVAFGGGGGAYLPQTSSPGGAILSSGSNVPTGGNILNIGGVASGVMGLVFNGSFSISGCGGSSLLGQGGTNRQSLGAGFAGSGFGAGGGGANVNASPGSFAGANGTPGVIIVMEYA